MDTFIWENRRITLAQVAAIIVVSYGSTQATVQDDLRVSGNAAYALGILSETEAGFHRVYYLANKDKTNKDRVADSSRSVLENLIALLVSEDAESVMNVAGTLGALAETQAGRTWMLESDCIDLLIDRITTLLRSDNTWTAGNSALVLARLSISEDGCLRLLKHKNYKTILGNLINSLGSAGRGTNAAFAIGRLCDQKIEQDVLETHEGLEKMVTQLYKMLNSDDIRWSKNACFAISCLANKKWGQDKVLSSYFCSEILSSLAGLLFAEDQETGWFSAVTLNTLASLPKGCLQIRKNSSVEKTLKRVLEVNPNAELKGEVMSALEFLKRLPKPDPPKVQNINASEIKVKWDPVISKSGFPITYKIFKDNQCVYEGQDCDEVIIDSLEPARTYGIQLQACAEEDDSPLSDVVTAITVEEVPSPPLNLQIVGRTVNLLKISWDRPQYSNGTIKFYHVLTEITDETGSSRIFESTAPETSSIISGLTAGTTYKVQVLAVNSKGKGQPASIEARTSEAGSHVPPKPNVTVIGRNELHVTWSTPAEPLGRIHHYELSMDSSVIYSGNDMHFHIHRLTPDTEYNFVVSAVTSEGRFDSKIMKKRTAKDEYEVNNPKVLATAEIATAAEETNARTTVSRRCKSACIPLKSGRPSSKVKNPRKEVARTGKTSTADSHYIKRSSVHSATQRFDCNQRKMSVKSSIPTFTANRTSHEEKSNGKSVLMFPSYINISLGSSNPKDEAVNVVRNGRLVRAKTFVFSQSNRSSGRQLDKSANGIEVSCGAASTPVQNDYNCRKTIDATNNTMTSIIDSRTPIIHSACRMWSVPSAFRSKSAIRNKPNKSSTAITSRFSNFFIRSCHEDQARSVFNSHRWLAMERRPCLELRVPVSTPETANTLSTSSRKNSTYSDSSSTDKKQVCFEDISMQDDQQTDSKDPIAQEGISQESLLQSLQTLEINDRITNGQVVTTKNDQDSLSGIQLSSENTERQIIDCSERSTEGDEKIKTEGSIRVCSEISECGKDANSCKNQMYKGLDDLDKTSPTRSQKPEKESGYDRNGHFVSKTSNILPFNENNLNSEKCWKKTDAYSKRAKSRTVRSARILKYNRSASAPRRPGTVSVSESGRQKLTGDKSTCNEAILKSESSAKSLRIRTMSLTPTPNIIEPCHKNSLFSEGFVPSQLRTQPCNLNLRQLQRIHTTLLGIRGNNDKLVIQTLLYQRNQNQQRSITQTNDLIKSSKRLIQRSATMRGSSHSYRKELITGTSKIPLYQRNMEPDSILLRQSWTS